MKKYNDESMVVYLRHITQDWSSVSTCMIMVGGGDSPSWKNEWMTDLKIKKNDRKLGIHGSKVEISTTSSTNTATTWDMSTKIAAKQLRLCEIRKAAEIKWILTAKIGSIQNFSNQQLSTGKHTESASCTTTSLMCCWPPATRHKDRCVQSTM